MNDEAHSCGFATPIIARLPDTDNPLTAEQVRDLEEIVADAAAPDLLRSAARRVSADPTRPVQAYADDVRAALNHIDGSMPADVTPEDIERDVRHASEEVRLERLRGHAELRTGAA
jgi:hypothetical protein